MEQDRKPTRIQTALECTTQLGIEAVKFMSVIAAVVIGTALGNGLPMARSMTTAFDAGLRTGISQCPCAKKSPTPTKRTPTPIQPVAEPKQSEPAKPVPVTIEGIEPVANREGGGNG